MLAEIRARVFGYAPEPLVALSTSTVTYGNVEAHYLHAHDGDTFTVDIQSYPPLVGAGISVRVYGIDCPEITDPRPEVRWVAVTARDFTRHALEQAKLIILHNLRRDKYFRILADVDLDGQDLGKQLLAYTLARPYDGGTKLPW